ncbi:MAG: exodeoxyribonuclease VII large subunit, partial [Kiritimatiellae bacterium]|nr:exodeoxyribonuclease VII large subunit [Kiritimatiellia bacterium]
MPAAAPETVTALAARIRGGLEQWFRDVWVEGELSNVRFVSSSPHVYFTVKDAGAQISCTFFNAARSPDAARVLRDGAKVRLRGGVSFYGPQGRCQLVVRSAEPVGEGELMLRFEALKRRLAAEGLFDPAQKRPLPALPRVVGIVTSPTGAAIRDMLNVTRRRFAGLHVLLAPARVQGDGAAEEIAAAIALLNRVEPRPDVLIVGRGGGSIEDLWCFNEEVVARAVRASAIPVVSAVGHETDFTICDFAADLRAPTPSAAAELVVKNREDLVATVASLWKRLSLAGTRAAAGARARLELCARSRAFAQPAALVRDHAQRVDLLAQRLDAALLGGVHRARLRLGALSPRPEAAARARLAAARSRLDALRAAHAALDPMAVLARGYALVRGPAGGVVTRAAALAPGDRFSAVFRDGADNDRIGSAALY